MMSWQADAMRLSLVSELEGPVRRGVSTTPLKFRSEGSQPLHSVNLYLWSWGGRRQSFLACPDCLLSRYLTTLAVGRGLASIEQTPNLPWTQSTRPSRWPSHESLERP